MVFYGNFDFPQNFLGDYANALPKGTNTFRRVKIEYRLKILIVKIFGGVDTAPAHHAVSRADR